MGKEELVEVYDLINDIDFILSKKNITVNKSIYVLIFSCVDICFKNGISKDKFLEIVSDFWSKSEKFTRFFDEK